MLVADAGTDHEVRAALVEVEAYLGLADPASHAFRGPTPRASIMFGTPARLYVYLSYGLHHCANIVCEPAGRAGAVLLRSAEVIAGAETVAARRRLAPRRGEAAGWRERGERPVTSAADAPPGRPIAPQELLRGPGNLCRGLGISLRDNGVDVGAGSRLRVLARPAAAPPLVTAPRVGISAATDRRLRFAWLGHPAVSRPVPGPTDAEAGPGQ